MLTVETAQRRLLKIVRRVDTETVSLLHARGRVLATDIRSGELPSFDNSSVDGFAARSADLQFASPKHPVELIVVGDIPAGLIPLLRIHRGQAARIMTGAPLPHGADVVVMLEDTDQARLDPVGGLPAVVRVRAQPDSGSNIRRRGSDVRRGELVLAAGHVLRPQDLGLLAMLGFLKVRVSCRPRVAVLSSGDELVKAGQPLRPGSIPDTNSTMLASLVDASGGQAIRLGIARDSKRSIAARLDKAMVRRPDMIVTSAGVSVGAFDLVRDVVSENGRMHFWRVNVRPGKPLAVGEYRGIPFCGLPGNPVSAFVAFELFVKPAIAKLAGTRQSAPTRIVAQLAEPVQSDGRESYLRAIVENVGGYYRARLTGHQGSGNLLSLVQANALLVIPAGVKSLPADSQADVWLL